MRAFIYGSEVAILDFYLARMYGTPYCTVRILESGLIEKVPTSFIEIRK